MNCKQSFLPIPKEYQLTPQTVQAVLLAMSHASSARTSQTGTATQLKLKIRTTNFTPSNSLSHPSSKLRDQQPQTPPQTRKPLSASTFSRAENAFSPDSTCLPANAPTSTPSSKQFS